MKCVAVKETTGRGTGNTKRKRPVGYVRKVHHYAGGDFCVNCGAVRR